MTQMVGVDIGGSGIKAGLVDVSTGELVGERVRVKTPQPAEPDAVVAATAEAIGGFSEDLPVGIGFPSAIVGGVIMTATHIADTWIGFNGEEAFEAVLGRRCTLLNDADAAGLAEARFGEGRGVPGVVLMLTLGTGIGSALFIDGRLVPNTEFGHIEIRGTAGENRAAASRRKADELSWKDWAGLVQEYLERVDRLVWPDLMILGGGVSRKAEKFVPLLHVRPKLVTARLKNRAGIIGAACRADEVLG